MPEQTFIKVNAIIGRADDKPITTQEQDEFNNKLVEWLKANGYDACAILELVTDKPDNDITRLVKCGDIDGENMALYECACGHSFDYWSFILGIYPDMPTECPICGRQMYFSYTTHVYEVAGD